MITFSKFGRAGRLGNQLFQYASLLGMSRKYGCKAMLPQWEYAKCFTNPSLVTNEHICPDLTFNEASFSYSGDEFDQHISEYETKVVDIFGWLQSEKYWDHCKDDVMAAFNFQPHIENSIIHKFRTAFEKPVIAISVRRGDFVDNPNYAQLPITYYLLSLYENFTNLTDLNILVFSDDMPYCKVHFAGLKNIFYAEVSPIEQLCLGKHCQHFIISNSTFSWWLAYLGEKEDSKVIRPNYLFDGDLLRRNSDTDYWPERWTVYDHKTIHGDNKKLHLMDATFTIPVHIDHKDRSDNLALNVCMIQRYFETNIIVGEQGNQQLTGFKQYCRYHYFEGMQEFHRTKMLNEMAAMTDTPIVVNWDADVFASPCQIYEAARSVRNGELDICYPFDGRMARVFRSMFYRLERALDVGTFGEENFRGTAKEDQLSVGGAVFFDKRKFFDGGGEDENYISYGPEDVARYERFNKLGYKVGRVSGILYHIDHFIGPNSGNTNPHFTFNHALLHKERLMSKDTLRAYVDAWPWRHPYTENYYAQIVDSAVVSWEHIWNAFFSSRNGEKNIHSVLDIGCGLGEAISKLADRGIEAFGIDYKIPTHKLLIPKNHYAEFDLTSDELFPFDRQFDLVVCTEVMEHIPEKYAGQCIDLLCELGKTVLFSAAIPGQGGVSHINEQWQSYWEKLFMESGYQASTALREQIFANEQIDIWYRNNLILFVQIEDEPVGLPMINFVHPKMFSNIVQTLKGK